MTALVGRIKDRPHAEAMDEVDRLVAALRGEADPTGRAERGSVLDWSTLRRLAGEGLTLGIHTRTHPLLDRVRLETAVEEIRGARDDLEREVGPTLPVLAYPSGAHGGDAVEAARRAGIELAFTTRRGGVDLRRADPLRLPRINVGRRAGAPLIRTQLVWASVFDARPR
jgi:peptidoglycan/xylan/chitin deacetylase (PgdA/CDA1 family)